jgi:hypothetical protein
MLLGRRSNSALKLLLLDRVLRSKLTSQELVCLTPKTFLRAPELLKYSEQPHTNSLASLSHRSLEGEL